MAGVPYTPQEIVEIFWAPDGSVADFDAMTEVEAQSLTRITQFLREGIPSPAGSQFVDAGTLASGFQAQVASVYGGGSGDFNVVRYRDPQTPGDDSEDVAFALFSRRTTGNFVVYPYGVSDTSDPNDPLPEEGDTYTSYPVEVGNRGEPIARGELMVGTISVAFNGLPHELKQVVGGGTP